MSAVRPGLGWQGRGGAEGPVRLVTRPAATTNNKLRSLHDVNNVYACAMNSPEMRSETRAADPTDPLAVVSIDITNLLSYLPGVLLQ